MNNPIFILLFLMAFHWVGDFVFQTRWMALNKSHNNLALLVHVGCYAMAFCLGVTLLYGERITVAGTGLTGTVLPTAQIASFVFVNAALHFATDYITSRFNA